MKITNRLQLRHIVAALALGVSFCLSTSAYGVIVLGGTNNGNLSRALGDLGYTFTNASGTMTPNPTTYGLGSGDTIIIGNDGGSGPFLDYTSFLQAGGHVIVAGGSSLTAYRNWVSLYFSITDTGSGWHTDGAWHTTAAVSSSSLIPANYTFGGNNATYHMLGFNPSADTVLYGKNDENVAVAAIRTYTNGGTFDYMALDLGVVGYASETDYQTFIKPWLQGAMNHPAAVPDSATTAVLILLGTAPLFAVARRKSRA